MTERCPVTGAECQTLELCNVLPCEDQAKNLSGAKGIFIKNPGLWVGMCLQWDDMFGMPYGTMQKYIDNLPSENE